MAQILVVDDDADLRRLLSLRLRSAGHAVEVADSGTTALASAAATAPDVVITDLRMDGMDGMALFEALRRRLPALPVIVLTAHGTIPDAVAATQKGVHGYLTKPFDGKELLRCVEQALGSAGPAPSGEAQDWRRDIVTRSAVMEALLQRARLLARSEASVLISGESGTGKELVAQAVHRASDRYNQPFVPVNCAAIPENLFESELFGHVRGAFTGSVGDKEGLIASAHRGTLFLDEVGELPLAFQAKLLRALQQREVRAVGATAAMRVDVRVISATNRDLREEVRAGRFREDLLYRLEVGTLDLPPLSERPEDIPLLVQRFLEQLATRSRHPVRSFAPDALSLLVEAPWPGNVRQLHNVVEQCVALTTGGVVPADRVREALREESVSLPTLDEVRNEAERDYLVKLLRLTRGNVSQAARLASRNRTEFYKLLGRHALDPGRFRDE